MNRIFTRCSLITFLRLHMNVKFAFFYCDLQRFFLNLPFHLQLARSVTSATAMKYFFFSFNDIFFWKQFPFL